MRYDEFQYLWPPRPDSKRAIPPMMIPFHTRQGFVGQVKKNGTCNVIAISPDGKMIAMNRHNEDHKLWSPTRESSAAFADLPGQGWYVFVAELLHSKVPGIRDINYIFDILVADGDYLVGRTFGERQAILDALFPEQIGETFSHRIINPNTWVAKLIPTGVKAIYDGLTAPEDEGIVMKKVDAKLELCSRQGANTSWVVKCRKQHKNFSF